MSGLPRFRLLLTAVALISLAGCPNRSTTKEASSGTPEAKGEAAVKPAEEMLNSAIYPLRPQHLGIDSDAVTAVAVLNSWREQSPLFNSDKFPINDETLKTVPAGWLNDTERVRMLSKEFTADDAIYIRNALLLSAMARTATSGKTAELDRIIALFNTAMQTVILQANGLPQLPFPLYEVVLLGQGTPDDRAWVFASLLKQQRIDAVLLQSKDDPEARLVGVILDGEVYLFDCRLGLPVPPGDESTSPSITKPATLREIAAHPDWWNTLTLRADQPYPWSTETLQQADVFVIAEAQAGTGRMKQLETVLPGDAACVLYDPLIDSEAIPSLSKRIAAAHADWTADKLKFWPHPSNLVERAKQFNAQQLQQLRIAFQRVRVPLEVVKERKEKQTLTQDEILGKVNPFRDNELDDGVGQFKQIQPTDALWKARIQMLLGDLPAATTQFLRIRRLALETPPAELQASPQEFQLWGQLYQVAAADASFWSGVCKLQQDDFDGAAATLKDFLKRYSRSNWASGSQYLRVISLVHLNKLDEAKDVLATLPNDDPHRPGLEILARRWNATPSVEPKTNEKAE